MIVRLFQPVDVSDVPTAPANTRTKFESPAALNQSVWSPDREPRVEQRQHPAHSAAHARQPRSPVHTVWNGTSHDGQAC